MEIITDYVNAIQDKKARGIFSSVLDWVAEHYPQLDASVFWGAAAFTHHGTFIISFTPFKKYMTVGVEVKPLRLFAGQIEKAGYKTTKSLLQLPWDKPINHDLLRTLIDFNIADKKDQTTLWHSRDEEAE